MGSVKLIDNFLEKDLIDFLYQHFKNVPHYYGHSSDPKDINGNKFYSFECNFKDPLYIFLYFVRYCRNTHHSSFHLYSLNSRLI